MKLILVNQRYGHTRTIVIRGWMKGLLSLCLLGSPVALGYLGYELALADGGSNALVSQETGPLTSAPVSESEQLDDVEPAVLVPASGADAQSRKSVSAEGLFYISGLAAGINPPSLLAVQDTPLYSHALTLAVFLHGRLVDPAIYISHNLH